MITFEIRMEIKVLHKRGMSIRADLPPVLDTTVS